MPALRQQLLPACVEGQEGKTRCWGESERRGGGKEKGKVCHSMMSLSLSLSVSLGAVLVQASRVRPSTRPHVPRVPCASALFSRFL